MRLFFEDHEVDEVRDPLQAFLTNEALQEIASQTIKNLNRWEQRK